MGEGLMWEKECCCNAALMCPVEENHAMACMATIGSVLEQWALEMDLLEAYAEQMAAGTCDIDEAAKEFFCGCMGEMRTENASHEDIDAVLSTYSHGITSNMLSQVAENCCLEDVPVETTRPPTAFATTLVPERKEVTRRQMKERKELLR